MGVNLLMSFAFPALRERIGEARTRLRCGRIMVDSGAFTAFSKGIHIKLPDYAAYLEHWRGTWDHAVTLDVIGDPKATRANTAKLHARGIPVMPVFTRGESLAEFDAMIRDCGYICIGGTVGLRPDLVTSRSRVLQRRAADLGGGVHVLGMGVTRQIRTVVPYSADSTNLASSFRYGRMYFLDGQDVISVIATDRAKVRAHWADLRAHDLDLTVPARQGRLPPVEGGQRAAMFQRIALSFAVADEWMKGHRHAPVPHGINDIPGPHLYSAVLLSVDLHAAAELDGRLHDGWTPPVWAPFAAGHRCRTTTLEAS